MSTPTNNPLQEIKLRIAAGYPIVWIQTDEHARVAFSILQQIEEDNNSIKAQIQSLQEKGQEIPSGLEPTTILVWDVINGLVDHSTSKCLMPIQTGGPAPTPAYKHILSWGGQIESVKIPKNAIILVNGFHNLLDMTTEVGRPRAAFLQLIRPVTNKITADQNAAVLLEGLRENENYRTVLLLGPKTTSPILSPDILGYIETIDFPRPSTEELKEALQIQMEGREDTNGKDVLIDKTHVENCVRELRGTTLFQAENALTLTYVKHRSLNAHELRTQYKKIMELHPAIRLANFQETWENLIGFEVYKEFIQALFSPSEKPRRRRGILLLGISGGGKSHAAKATGNYLKWKTLIVTIGKVFNKHIGESESMMDSLLKSINGCGESIIFIDEIEKAFGGMGQGGDSGVSNRILEQFLIWMENHPDGPFLIGTANDLTEKLPAEFLREGRWDCTMFVPPPTLRQRQGLFELYGGIADLKLDFKAQAENTDSWSGAEIKGLMEKTEVLRRIFKSDEDALQAAYKFTNPLIKSDPEGLKKRIEDGQKRGINVNSEENEKLFVSTKTPENKTSTRRTIL